MKKIFGLLIIMLLCWGINGLAQGVVSRCETCGQTKNNCKYKGKHPKCKTCGQLTEKCKYRGKHPKCKTCGQLIEKCKYKGDHPKQAKPIEQQPTNLSDNGSVTPADPVLSGYENGYEWVDLGLSVKWATQNIGAKTATDIGNYFYWCAPGMGTNIDWNNYMSDLVFGYDETSDKSGSGGIMNIKQSDGYDTARENWGGSWRLPTKDEIEELINKCQWNWTTNNGVNGFEVIGPNGKCIFLPSGGWINESKTECANDQGYYWSGSYRGKHGITAFGLHFMSPIKESEIRTLTSMQKRDAPKGSICYASPYRGHTVRAVTK